MSKNPKKKNKIQTVNDRIVISIFVKNVADVFEKNSHRNIFNIEEYFLNLHVELWGAGTARTFRPIWMAEELGFSYKLHPIGPRTGETQTSEFKSLNPKQKIPVLKHEDFLLSESVSICRYLRSISPSETMYQPKSHQDIAIEDAWCNFIYGELDETSLYIMRRHHDLQQIYGGSREVVSSCRRYFEKQLPIIEEALAKGDFLCGHDFGLADILLVSCLDWSTIYQIELPKNTIDYLKKIRSRDAYKRAFEINYKDLIL